MYVVQIDETKINVNLGKQSTPVINKDAPGYYDKNPSSYLGGAGGNAKPAVPDDRACNKFPFTCAYP